MTSGDVCVQRKGTFRGLYRGAYINVHGVWRPDTASRARVPVDALLVVLWVNDVMRTDDPDERLVMFLHDDEVLFGWSPVAEPA